MSAPFSVLVADDERPSRANVARLVAEDARFALAGEASSGLEALRAIEALHPDVLVLDVQMPGMTGFEVLEALGPDHRMTVIFSTAYDAHALRAFEAHAIDYLLKPYDGPRFRRALDKAWAQVVALQARPETKSTVLDAAASALSSRPRARLALRTATEWVTVSIDDINRISAADKHVHVSLHDGPTHIVRQTLAAMLERLDPARFVRVHRSEVVNIDAVTSLQPWTHGDAILVLRDGSSVVLSRTHRQAFRHRFGG